MPKITKRTIDALPPDAPRQIVWDSELKGFGLIALPSGVRSFFVQYRNETGRQRRLTLGRYGVLTVDQARKAAQQALAGVSEGKDPLAARQTHRDAPTVSRLLDRYLAEHVEVHNGERTATEVRGLIERHIRAGLGALKTSSVTRQDIAKFHRSLERAPRSANIALTILSKAFNLAELWGIRPEGSNPCLRIPRFPENSRERFLSAEELANFGRVFEEAETIGLPWQEREGAKAKHRSKEENRRTPIGARTLAALKLLLFTGARLSEILELQWAHIDLERGTIALPGRKGGGRQAHPVSTMALAIIAELGKVEGSPWIFPAPRDLEKHLSLSVVENAWRRIRDRAGAPDVRIHDLRHTIGTYASQTGVNAFGVRDLLRHATIAMTGRYANRDADPIRSVSEAVGARVAAGLSGGAGGEVVPLKPKGAAK
jgi:integrase